MEETMEEGREEVEGGGAGVEEVTGHGGKGLREVPLQKILIGLHDANKTGILAVRTPGFIKKIYIEKGEVVFAASNWKDDRLGEVLLKAGKITLQQNEESVGGLKMR